MKKDSEATKARFLAAATDEFAEYGVAGARVDRIARAAGSNKQLIYAYFGSKEKLFEAVVDAGVLRLVDAVPLDPNDLTGYAGGLFDYYVSHPELLRLLTWKRLEARPDTPPNPGLSASYREKIAVVEGAMKAGDLASTFEPTELLALVESVTTTWVSTTPELVALDSGEPFSKENVARYRKVVVEAVGRLLLAARG